MRRKATKVDASMLVDAAPTEERKKAKVTKLANGFDYRSYNGPIVSTGETEAAFVDEELTPAISK